MESTGQNPANLDCGSLTSAGMDGNRRVCIYANYLRKGAGDLRDLGVKAELEFWETGNLWFASRW